MKHAVAVITFLLIVMPAALVVADCYIDGRQVPEGTRLGPLVCEDGEWVYDP